MASICLGLNVLINTIRAQMWIFSIIHALNSTWLNLTVADVMALMHYLS